MTEYNRETLDQMEAILDAKCAAHKAALRAFDASRSKKNREVVAATAADFDEYLETAFIPYRDELEKLEIAADRQADLDREAEIDALQFELF